MAIRYKLKIKEDCCLICNRPIGNGILDFSVDLSNVITDCGYSKTPEKFFELCYQCAVRCLSWKNIRILNCRFDGSDWINPENGPLKESDLIYFIADQIEVLSRRISNNQLPYRCHAYCGKYGEKHICPNYAAHIVDNNPLCDQHKNIYLKRGLCKIYKGEHKNARSVQLAKILLEENKHV